MPRTKQLAPHVGRHSRTQVAKKRGAHKGPRTAAARKPEAPAPYKEVNIGGSKNGQTRLVPTTKAPRFYPAEDVKKPVKARKTNHITRLRASITPGTILILLAGRFKGKRVVFLKQLASGLLLVTGPFKVNGVPLRRVNQAYVIATSTKIELSGLKVDDSLNDSYFSKEKADKSVSAEEEFFSGGKPKPKEACPSEKSKLQKEVDSSVVSAIKKVENLSKYLKSTWGLSKGQFPHNLVF